MKIFLFDSTLSHQNLLPLSFTRPVADFRCGILTIREKWEKYLHSPCRFFPVNYLRQKYGGIDDADEEAVFIAGNLLPRFELIKEIKNLKNGEALVNEAVRAGKETDSSLPSPEVLAFKGTLKQLLERNFERKSTGHDAIINYVFDIFLSNPEEIKLDYRLITAGRRSLPLPDCVRMLCQASKNDMDPDPQASVADKAEIFIEPGAVVECGTINISEGPVYIGKDSILMEGSCIRGPFAMCEGGEVRMGAKIYEGTTIGPHCKVGGEVSNTVFFGFSNKAHDGYLGNAVIGEWCNIGAGANASNLKNDYSLIRVWNYHTQSFMRTDLQFCGLIMGDHSKIGVNCMINTATVMGVGVNLHGAGFPRTFLPCFCEGSPVSGFSQVPLKKFLDTASRVMSRRDIPLSPQDEEVLKHIYEN